MDACNNYLYNTIYPESSNTDSDNQLNANENLLLDNNNAASDNQLSVNEYSLFDNKKQPMEQKKSIVDKTYDSLPQDNFFP